MRSHSEYKVIDGLYLLSESPRCGIQYISEFVALEVGVQAVGVRSGVCGVSGIVDRNVSRASFHCFGLESLSSRRYLGRLLNNNGPIIIKDCFLMDLQNWPYFGRLNVIPLQSVLDHESPQLCTLLVRIFHV